MRKWPRYWGGVVATAGLLGLATRADGETCSLELKKVETTSSSRENYIFQATYPHSFSMPISAGIRFGQQDDLPEFVDVIKKEPDQYQAKQPVRGVIKLGSQHFGYVLDSSVKGADEEVEKKETEEADTRQEGGLLLQLGRMLFGSKKGPKDKKSFQAVPYDRLYFDRNHNGDLTDEEVVKARSTDSDSTHNYFATSFPRIDVPIEVDSTQLDYAFTLRVTAYGSGNHAYLSGSVNSATYREGEITLGDKKHRLVLLDFNSNGRFDDKPAINTSVRAPDGRLFRTYGDRLYIDPDLKNRSRNPYGPATDDDLYDVSKLIHLDGRFYELSVSPAGDKLSLEPSNTAVGYVSNPNEGFRAVVYGEQGFMKVRSDESGKFPLPIGKWKLEAYTIDRTGMLEPKKAELASERSILGVLTEVLGPTTEARAPRSTSVSANATMKYNAVEVKEGETAELPFGPPYRPAVDVQYRQGTNTVSLGLALVGVADEICSNMQIAGQRPGKPSFTITTSDGNTVAEGEFEYG
ncbi:MAG: hypothetical protein A2W31_09655 [Planctomycetes bacterium RBG_16_64_10]|nr:MAG: hypothetical protein A2W31_09655 [Planctomycetes bacterium RBG_16_64_10]